MTDRELGGNCGRIPIQPLAVEGYCEGDVCGRDGCEGIIKSRDVENCSCHINPPCSQCTTPREYCPVCDWEAEEEINEL